MTTKEQKPLIIPEQLRAAREAMALSVDEVARRLGVKPEGIRSWERGVSEPSIEQLWVLTELYERSTDYFLKRTTPMPVGLNLRLTSRKIVADLPLEARQVLVRFEELCRAENELEKMVGVTGKVLVERARAEWGAEELAQRERKRFGLDNRPVRDFRDLLQKLGVRVFLLPVPGNEFSGISWWHSEYGPGILINAFDIAGRRNFTLAHEYAHLLRSDPPTVCDLEVDVEEETFANKFAANFLMPRQHVEAMFLQRFGSQHILPSKEQLGYLAGRYGVSLEAMGRRLEDLGLAPRGATDERIAELREWKVKSFGKGKKGRKKGPTWQRQLGERYVNLTFDAHKRGYISAGRLAQYLGVDVWEAYDLIREFEIPPRAKQAG